MRREFASQIFRVNYFDADLVKMLIQFVFFLWIDKFCGISNNECFEAFVDGVLRREADAVVEGEANAVDALHSELGQILEKPCILLIATKCRECINLVLSPLLNVNIRRRNH